MAYFGFTNKLLKGETIKIFNYGNCKRDFNYICINIFGYMAAAYTTLVAYIVLAGAQVIFARKIHLKETGEKSVYNDRK